MNIGGLSQNNLHDADWLFQRPFEEWAGETVGGEFFRGSSSEAACQSGTRDRRENHRNRKGFGLVEGKFLCHPCL